MGTVMTSYVFAVAVLFVALVGAQSDTDTTTTSQGWQFSCGSLQGSIRIEEENKVAVTVPTAASTTGSFCERSKPADEPTISLKWDGNEILMYLRVDVDSSTFQLHQLEYYEDGKSWKNGDDFWYTPIYGYKGLIDGELKCKQSNTYQLIQNKKASPGQDDGGGSDTDDSKTTNVETLTTATSRGSTDSTSGDAVTSLPATTATSSSNSTDGETTTTATSSSNSTDGETTTTATSSSNSTDGETTTTATSSSNSTGGETTTTATSSSNSTDGETTTTATSLTDSTDGETTTTATSSSNSTGGETATTAISSSNSTDGETTTTATSLTVSTDGETTTTATSSSNSTGGETTTTAISSSNSTDGETTTTATSLTDSTDGETTTTATSLTDSTDGETTANSADRSSEGSTSDQSKVYRWRRPGDDSHIFLGDSKARHLTITLSDISLQYNENIEAAVKAVSYCRLEPDLTWLVVGSVLIGAGALIAASTVALRVFW